MLTAEFVFIVSAAVPRSRLWLEATKDTASRITREIVDINQEEQESQGSKNQPTRGFVRQKLANKRESPAPRTDLKSQKIRDVFLLKEQKDY